MQRSKIIGGLTGLLGTLALVASANAEIVSVQISPLELPGLVDSVNLEVIDDVSDGCWTGARAVRTQVTQMLEAAGIDLADGGQADSAFHPAMIVSAAGERVNDAYCIVQTEVRVSFVSYSQFAESNADGNVLLLGVNTISTMFRANVAIVADDHVNDEITQWVGQVVGAFTQDVATKRQMQGIQTLRQSLGLTN